MSDVVTAAVAALNAKLSGESFDGKAKFVIEGEGDIVLENDAARAAVPGEEADVTLTATPETFEDLLTGNLNPTSAFMTGKLSVDGDMGMAMKLGAALS